MSIVKVGSNIENLKVSDFSGYDIVERICYVLDYSSGQSALKQGYFRLILKTEEGAVVSGMIFNPDMYKLRGFDIASLRGKFIKVQGDPQIYNGSYSLIINEIENIDQETVVNKQGFQGIVNGLDEMFEEVSTNFKQKGLVLPTILKTTSYADIYEGRIGGYVKFIYNLVISVIPFSDELAEYDMIQIVYYVTQVYSKYLDRKAKCDIITPSDKLDIIRSYDRNGEIANIVDDCICAILEIGEPQHLVSHVIYNNFKCLLEVSKLYSMWEVMPIGGVKKLDAGLLKRY